MVLKARRLIGIEVEASRHLANLKGRSYEDILPYQVDYKIYNDDHEIPVRTICQGQRRRKGLPVMLFFHGGGWVTESIDNYERIGARMARPRTISTAGYRLAPEYKFPTGLK